MNGIDVALGIILLIGAFRGYRDGFLMAVVTFLAIILGVLGAFKLMGSAIVLLKQQFELDENVLPYLAFALVFIAIVIAVSFLGRMLRASVEKSFFGLVDQALGAVIGILKMAFMASIVFWIVDSLTIQFPSGWVEDSWLYPPVAGFAPVVTEWVGALIPAFRDIFNV